jgi:hypothetical protein
LATINAGMRRWLRTAWLAALLALAASVLAVSPAGASTAAAATCGVERWAVKTMSDRDAGAVNLNPVASSVAALVGFPAPAAPPPNRRVRPVEVTTYTLSVALVAMKLENDRDIHLVIATPARPSQTMIVEFPDAPACTPGTAPALATRMHNARAAFTAAFGQPGPGLTRISGSARITGVGFFDRVHGQAGVAPNGIELHPVLAFSKGP